jgi:hypothetical protein
MEKQSNIAVEAAPTDQKRTYASAKRKKKSL